MRLDRGELDVATQLLGRCGGGVMSTDFEANKAAETFPSWAALSEDPEVLVVAEEAAEGVHAVRFGDLDGGTVVYGTIEELRALAARLVALVEQEPPALPKPLEVGDWVWVTVWPEYVGRLVVADDDDGERLDAMDGQLDDPLLVQWPGDGGRQWVDRDQLRRAAAPEGSTP